LTHAKAALQRNKGSAVDRYADHPFTIIAHPISLVQSRDAAARRARNYSAMSLQSHQRKRCDYHNQDNDYGHANDGDHTTPECHLVLILGRIEGLPVLGVESPPTETQSLTLSKGPIITRKAKKNDSTWAMRPLDRSSSHDQINHCPIQESPELSALFQRAPRYR
jgi:hypothetical protein